MSYKSLPYLFGHCSFPDHLFPLFPAFFPFFFFLPSASLPFFRVVGRKCIHVVLFFEYDFHSSTKYKHKYKIRSFIEVFNAMGSTILSCLLASDGSSLLGHDVSQGRGDFLRGIPCLKEDFNLLHPT